MESWITNLEQNIAITKAYYEIIERLIAEIKYLRADRDNAYDEAKSRDGRGIAYGEAGGCPDSCCGH